MIDIGDVYPITLNVKSSAGVLVAAGTVVVTVTAPDGTTSTPTVTTSTTGVYVAAYTTTMAGLHSWSATASGGSLTYAQATSDVFYVQSAVAPMVSLAEVKAHLRMTTTNFDEQLRSLIKTACQLIEQHAQRVWVKRTVVDNFEASTPALRLRTQPVVSITSVTVEGTALTGYTLTDAGILWHSDVDGDSRFSGTVVVTYTAGVSPQVIPETIRTAVLEQVRHLWETQSGGKGATSQGDLDPATEQQFAIPWRVRQLIEATPDLGVAL